MSFLTVIGLHDQPAFTDIKDFTNKTVDMFCDGTFDELYIYYNHYVNAIKHDVTEKKFLPFTDMKSNSGKTNHMNLNHLLKKF